MASWFLSGVGGSGMSALASLLLARGDSVAGSDRSHDRGETPEKFAKLEAAGVRLQPQDGSGLHVGLNALIVSSAVEESVPDVQAARRLGLPVHKRAEVLADIVNAAKLSITVGGTSGKSTVTAMTGWILAQAGLNPTIVNGAPMGNFASAAGLGNAVTGDPDVIVAEVDESDGSIALFRPTIAVLTNISLDHKPMPELRNLFRAYIASAKAAIVNADDAESLAMAPPAATLFSLRNDGAFILPVPGRHNRANALAAIAATTAAGVPIETAKAALKNYRGVHRRFEIVGTARGVTVIDDFAHNPDKIVATLDTLHETQGRIIAVFQPHGFAPTRLLRADLVLAFASHLAAEDILLMPEIYYAGGTTARDISSRDIVADVAACGRNTEFIAARCDIPRRIAVLTKAGDRVVVMGARDDTLPAFAAEILKALAS